MENPTSDDLAAAIAELPEDQREMLTMREAAEILEVSYSHACELVRTGRIPKLGHNPAGLVMARTRDVLEYKRDRRTPENAKAIAREVVPE